MEYTQKTLISKADDVMTRDGLNTLASVLMNTQWVIRWRGREQLVNISDHGFTFEIKSGGGWLGRCTYTYKTTGRNSHTYIKTANSKILLNSNWLDLNYGGKFLFQFEDTLRHEIAHAIHVILNGKTDHSRDWQSIAEQILADPTRIADEEKIYGMRIKSPYKATCKGCGRVTYAWKKPRCRKSCGRCSSTFDERYIIQFAENRWWDAAPVQAQDKFKQKNIKLK